MNSANTIQHPKVTRWLCETLPPDVCARIARMATHEDVVQIAVMPDVHLSKDYCVGTAVATKSTILPQAVGGDIGCGMLAARLNCESNAIVQIGDRLLELLRGLIPIIRHRATTAVTRLPQTLAEWELSDPRLERLKSRDGRVQLGTIGRGNHFLEFQTDEQGQAWIMLHSGSRGMGQAITAHHLNQAKQSRINKTMLSFAMSGANAQRGRDYFRDQEWAREYARQNRLRMMEIVTELLQVAFHISLDESSIIHSDHNHVQRETHGDHEVWVHRKGAQSAHAGEAGVIPGSMGSASYHVTGRGNSAAMHTSSHGAGRRMSRTEARHTISEKSLRRQMKSVIFDVTQSDSLRDESPEAYKDIRRVMQAQRDLVRIERRLEPLLSFKG